MGGDGQKIKAKVLQRGSTSCVTCPSLMVLGSWCRRGVRSGQDRGKGSEEIEGVWWMTRVELRFWS